MIVSVRLKCFCRAAALAATTLISAHVPLRAEEISVTQWGASLYGAPYAVAMEKGLASVEGELSELRSLPANLKDLEGAAHRIDATTTSFDARLGDLRAHVRLKRGTVRIGARRTSPLRAHRRILKDER